jgi:hypothetical protein
MEKTTKEGECPVKAEVRDHHPPDSEVETVTATSESTPRHHCIRFVPDAEDPYSGLAGSLGNDPEIERLLGRRIRAVPMRNTLFHDGRECSCNRDN